MIYEAGGSEFDGKEWDDFFSQSVYKSKFPNITIELGENESWELNEKDGWVDAVVKEWNQNYIEDFINKNLILTDEKIEIEYLNTVISA